MKRKSPICLISLLFVALLTCALALQFVAVNAPASALGENLLHWEYDHSTDKNAVLQEYRARIWAHGGGYVPDNAARFLAGRLKDGNAAEVAAIARFYSSQGAMREGNFGQLLSERARQRLVDAITRDWRSYPEKNAWRAFVFIETLRQNKYLGKANVQGPNFPGSYPYSYAKLAPVAALFGEWNRFYRTTPIIQRPDPLAGTDYFIAAT